MIIRSSEIVEFAARDGFFLKGQAAENDVDVDAGIRVPEKQAPERFRASRSGRRGL
jgi:hypothetical protein